MTWASDLHKPFLELSILSRTPSSAQRLLGACRDEHSSLSERPPQTVGRIYIPPAGLLFASASLGQHSLSKVCSSKSEESVVFQDGKPEITVSGWAVPILRRAWPHTSFLHWSHFSTVASTGKWLKFLPLGSLSEENQIGKKKRCFSRML